MTTESNRGRVPTSVVECEELDMPVLELTSNQTWFTDPKHPLYGRTLDTVVVDRIPCEVCHGSRSVTQLDPDLGCPVEYNHACPGCCTPNSTEDMGATRVLGKWCNDMEQRGLLKKCL